ncbi:MAG: oxidoreductase/nitrogenase component 1 [Firmicutes bacterium]|nr:oxidoreductase/nitrogenase component 1 [Bacillota bacterium]
MAKKVEQEIGIPVVPLHPEGFKSKHWSTGFDATQHGIMRQIVRKKPKKKQEDLVNVIALWGTDVFTPMLKELGLRVNYVVDLATVGELEQLSEAAATVGFCYTLASYLAAGLEQEFGVPEVKAPQPYGFAGTDAWIREKIWTATLLTLIKYWKPELMQIPRCLEKGKIHLMQIFL